MTNSSQATLIDPRHIVDTFARAAAPVPKCIEAALAEIHSTHASLDHLATIIADDAAVAARVLRIANSPFYGLRGEVTNLRDAFIVMGMQSLESLLVGIASMIRLSALKNASHSSDIYNESKRCAVIASEIAREFSLDTGTAFTAGLLHDIGAIAIAATYPADMAGLDTRTTDRLSAELATFGVTHCEVGLMLADIWYFPQAITTVIEHHHDDEFDQSPLCDLIALSDRLAHKAMENNPELSEVFVEPAAQRLKIDDAMADRIIERLPFINAAAVDMQD